MNLLFDTNLISELKRRRNAFANVIAWSAAVPSERIFTSVVVLGEIRRGIELIARRDKAQAASFQTWYASMREQFAERVLAVDEAVMNIWSKISVPDPLPAYDGLIAATALFHGVTVATRNTVDYGRVGVAVVDPWTATVR